MISATNHVVAETYEVVTIKKRSNLRLKIGPLLGRQLQNVLFGTHKLIHYNLNQRIYTTHFKHYLIYQKLFNSNSFRS